MYETCETKAGFPQDSQSSKTPTKTDFCDESYDFEKHGKFSKHFIG